LWQTKENSNHGLPAKFQDGCYNTFVSDEPTRSKVQDDVVAQLRSIGLEPEEEVLMDDGQQLSRM
jgi:hypothetical protein